MAFLFPRGLCVIFFTLALSSVRGVSAQTLLEQEQTWDPIRSYYEEFGVCGVFNDVECCPASFFPPGGSKSDNFCAPIECDDNSCTVECTEGDCSAYSLYACDDTVLECTFVANFDRALNGALLDGGTSENVVFQLGSDAFQSGVRTIVRTDERKGGKCAFVDGSEVSGNLGQSVFLCNRLEGSFLCERENCEGTYYRNPYAEHNDVTSGASAVGSGAVFVLEYSQKNEVKTAGTSALTLLNSYSHNIIKDVDARTWRYSELDLAYSNNEITMEKSGTLTDANVFAPYSKNKITCVASDTCTEALFNIRHSSNILFCESNIDPGACERSAILASNSHNDISCTEGSSCKRIYFEGTKSENKIRCDGIACQFAVFDITYSKNTFLCTDPGMSKFPCEDVKIDGSHSNNVMTCDGETSCRRIDMRFDYSDNKFLCKMADGCTEMTFFGRHSHNSIVCDNEACNSGVVLILNDSGNSIECTSTSCNGAPDKNVFLLNNSNNRVTCDESSCTAVTFDFRNSHTFLSCSQSSCNENVWIIEKGQFSAIVDSTSSGDFSDAIIDITALCYDSQCDIEVKERSLGQFSFACGGPESLCSIKSEDANELFYHCYKGARCSLQCDKNCGGFGDVEGNSVSTLNCESSAFCDVQCGEGCGQLNITVEDSPIRIQVQEKDKTCIVQNSDGDKKKCKDISDACYGGFLCNPSEFLEGQYPQCAQHPTDCVGSNCYLGHIAVGGSEIRGFNPNKRAYEVPVDPRAPYVEIFAAAVDYGSVVTIGDVRGTGTLSSLVKIPYGDNYVDVDITVCAVKRNTCFYHIRIVKDFGYFQQLQHRPQQTQNYKET